MGSVTAFPQPFPQERMKPVPRAAMRATRSRVLRRETASFGRSQQSGTSAPRVFTPPDEALRDGLLGWWLGAGAGCCHHPGSDPVLPGP
jgi:hypothetical protein